MVSCFSLKGKNREKLFNNKKKNTGLFEKKKEIENSVLFDNTYHIRSVTGTKNRLFAARTLRSGLSIVNIFCPAPSFLKSVLATHSLYTKIKKKHVDFPQIL